RRLRSHRPAADEADLAARRRAGHQRPGARLHGDHLLVGADRGLAGRSRDLDRAQRAGLPGSSVALNRAGTERADQFTSASAAPKTRLALLTRAERLTLS